MTKKQVARIRLIRKRRTYTVKELTKLLGVHSRTVQQWHTEGLEAIEESHPLLFLGQIAKDFLRSRCDSHKHKLKANEFFCMRCRLPRTAGLGTLTERRTGKRMGFDKEQVILRGCCSVCGCSMTRFGSRPWTGSPVCGTQCREAEGR